MSSRSVSVASGFAKSFVSRWPYSVATGPACARSVSATLARRMFVIVRTVRNSPIALDATSGRRKNRSRRALSDRSIVGDLVADTPDRHDGARLADLAPQLADVHVDRAGVAGERIAPDALEQLVARQHDAAVLEQGV